MLLLAMFRLSIDGTLCDHHEYRLYDDLMRDYKALERPVENHSTAVNVSIGIVLQQLVDVDEKNQVMIINAWIKYSWRDHKLRWEPREYGGITDVCARVCVCLPSFIVTNDTKMNCFTVVVRR